MMGTMIFMFGGVYTMHMQQYVSDKNSFPSYSWRLWDNRNLRYCKTAPYASAHMYDAQF